MKSKIFKSPLCVASLEKKSNGSYSPFIAANEEARIYANANQASLQAVDGGAGFGLVIVGTVVGQIVITAWPY